MKNITISLLCIFALISCKKTDNTPACWQFITTSTSSYNVTVSGFPYTYPPDTVEYCDLTPLEAKSYAEDNTHTFTIDKGNGVLLTNITRTTYKRK